MKIIQTLSEMVEEEICDAEKYIDLAAEVQDDYPNLADTLHKISLEEMGHMKLLHGEVAKIIAEYRKENGEPPESMLAVYRYLHGKSMDHAAEVKAKQDLYKA